MSKALITESHLTDIANAIIAKGGATGPMLPSEMADAIGTIGRCSFVLKERDNGGMEHTVSYESICLNDMIDSEGRSFSTSNIQKIIANGTGPISICYAGFSGKLGSIVSDTVKYIGYHAFRVVGWVSEIDIPNVEAIANGAMDSIGNKVSDVSLQLKRFNFPKCRILGYESLQRNDYIEEVILGDMISFGDKCLSSLPKLKVVDLTKCTSVPSLASVNSFYGIPDGAKIVIPDGLYERWITETNWSAAGIVGHIVKESEYEG